MEWYVVACWLVGDSMLRRRASGRAVKQGCSLACFRIVLTVAMETINVDHTNSYHSYKYIDQ